MELKELNHLDFFSGPGGICTGFRAAGLKTLVAIEKVKSCTVTYTANHKDVDVINKDIRKVTTDELINIVNGRQVDIITSGMPCETFSTAGSKSRSFYDFRQQLYSETIRLAKAVNSRIILFENVPAILTKKVEKDGDRLIVEDIIAELELNGYNNHKIVVLNAKDFGVPQNRNRFFLIASQDDDLELLTPDYKHHNTVTVGDALTGLPMNDANDKCQDFEYESVDNEYTSLLKNNDFWKLPNRLEAKVTYQLAPKHREGTVKRFKLIQPGESLVDLFRNNDAETVSRLQEERILPKKWYIQRNKRLKVNEPSKTVTSHCLDELVHPTLNRALTVREAARLQSFPDSYDFKGGPYICPHMYEMQDKYEQIGDAVPPLLAYHWGLTINKILQSNPELCLVKV